MLSSFRHIEFDPKQRQQFVLNFDVKKAGSNMTILVPTVTSLWHKYFLISQLLVKSHLTYYQAYVCVHQMRDDSSA